MSKCIEEKATHWNERGIESNGKAFGKGLNGSERSNRWDDITEIHRKEGGVLGLANCLADFGNMPPGSQDVERREIVAALTNHFQEEGVGTKVLTRPCWPKTF